MICSIFSTAIYKGNEMLRVIRRLLTVIIWVIALPFAVSIFILASDADGDSGPMVVRMLAIGLLVVAYALNMAVNWIFADKE